MHKAFPLPVIEFSLPEEVPTASEERKFKQWQFRIQQYLQHEHYALWEVIEFRDSYEVPKDNVTTGLASDRTGKKKGKTVALTTDDMQKRKNDVKARTTLLLALPDEHQLCFSKHKTAQELWVAILKTFYGNKATKKTKKNLLKRQYGNFKAKGSETLKQTFNRLSDLDTMSLDDLYNHLKVYDSEVQKKSESNSQNMAFISLAKHSSGNEKVNNASVSTASSNIGAASISQDTAWKKITIQGINVAGFDKSKVECFNYHKMGHFARECRAPRSQYRGRKDNYKQGSKIEEQAPKTLMEIDEVGWDWSYMANDEENHALVADEEAPTEFALMAKTSTESEAFDNSLCSKAYKKNTYSLNSKITELTDKLIDTKNMIYHYKLGLSQVEGRLAEFKNQEVKYCKKIRVLEFKVESRANCIESLTKELEFIEKEKVGLLEFADDTVTDYSRPSHAVESTTDDLQNRNPSVTETGASPDKGETVKKHAVKYDELYRKPSKSSSIRGNQRNWNNLKSQQLGVKMGRSSPKNNYTHRSMPHKPTIHKPYRPPMRPMRPNMNVAHPNRTSFYKPAHSYSKKPFQRTSAVRSQFRAPWVP
nr:hypothetical protein [Tanacetum cinerariifolium]